MGDKAAVSELLSAITPYSLPQDPVGQLIYDQATDATLKVTSNLTAAELTRAQCYFVAHLLSGKAGKAGVTSEHIGNVSKSYSLGNGSDPYYAEWDKLVSVAARSEIAASVKAAVHGDATRFP